MEHTSQAAHLENHGEGKKEIWRVTIILSVLTVIELALGFWMMGIENPSTRTAIKGVIIILMLAKAFYIVGYFMHLKHEIRNMIMTIVVPLLLFVWFITAFLYDGNSFRHLRNTYDPFKKERSEMKVEKKAESNEAKPEMKKAVE
ncbi:MAG: cytochrome C oxidase subunit IV family protein [Bacteroidota bacterium]|nr:cytochrome C oxidase subunit IV family protein [Bacteroidota bacterium]